MTYVLLVIWRFKFINRFDRYGKWGINYERWQFFAFGGNSDGRGQNRGYSGRETIAKLNTPE